VKRPTRRERRARAGISLNPALRCSSMNARAVRPRCAGWPSTMRISLSSRSSIADPWPRSRRPPARGAPGSGRRPARAVRRSRTRPGSRSRRAAGRAARASSDPGARPRRMRRRPAHNPTANGHTKPRGPRKGTKSATGGRSVSMLTRSGGSIEASGPSRLMVREVSLGSEVSAKKTSAVRTSQRSLQRTAHAPRKSRTP
jgi:hypothetical protein